ncbi:TIGR00300 family protein [Tepidibacillus fermentans]|uniref:ornithine cyclodeaminase n=1 Tax=Tepidibacillus fermentans TaxID=1281767 RepID=A0A4R3KK46_9BACI|nr:TIGR00300 family protein [Tepidibacillus fermentans]TCS83100.1 lysine-ketoglutarate reductase/saccharopine dehydrogenase-like protein (TIGR00300 family) [Tepidibacillus fermentans]
MEKVIQIKGHIIRDDIIKRIDASCVQYNGTYRVLELQIGRQVDDISSAKIALDINDEGFTLILNELTNLGIEIPSMNNQARLEPSEKDKTVPDDFYSTTNHPTEVFLDGKWVRVQNQRMDGVLVVKNGEVFCTKLRDVKKGDLIVCGSEGVRILTNNDEQNDHDFAFMVNDVSSERRVEIAVKKLAEEMKAIKAKKGKIIVVAGPVVIHTGGMDAFQDMIRKGFISGLLSGNALAVHDIERDLFGTSLGVDLDTGKVVKGGHKNHMRAINAVNKSGSIRQAVEDGTVKSGIMYELVKHNIPFVLAGSIRDDGPLPDTMMDLIEAQEAYAQMVKDADMVIMLSTMLHSIGTGNMLPSWVKTVVVDINPAVVAKLVDRGSAQAKGLVTDVGLFLTLLNQQL